MWRAPLNRLEEQRGLWVHKVTPADVLDFITPHQRGLCRFPAHNSGTRSTSPSTRKQQGSCSKGHWHTGGLQTCLSMKRPSVLLINSSRKNPPNSRWNVLIHSEVSDYGARLQITISSLRSIWCAMEKAEQLVFYQPFKSWCMKKRKLFKEFTVFLHQFNIKRFVFLFFSS